VQMVKVALSGRVPEQSKERLPALFTRHKKWPLLTDTAMYVSNESGVEMLSRYPDYMYAT